MFADLERAARLLDTGLWSFNWLAQGERTRQQLRDAAKAAEEARTQVVDALKQARAAWKEIRKPEQAGYEGFREMLRERREAIRGREGRE